MPQVQSVGKFGDMTALVGEVKIEEGANISITRDDAHNSLIIADTRPPEPGCQTSFWQGQQRTYQPTITNPTFTTGVS